MPRSLRSHPTLGSQPSLILPHQLPIWIHGDLLLHTRIHEDTLSHSHHICSMLRGNTALMANPRTQFSSRIRSRYDHTRSGDPKYRHCFIWTNIVTFNPSSINHMEKKQEATLHILDVRRELAFYLDRTKLFRKSPWLCLSFTEGSRGSAISKQILSIWISECIHLCYGQHNLQPPLGAQTHSTQLLST